MRNKKKSKKNKKRLDEGTIRRFMGLANIEPLASDFLDRKNLRETEELAEVSKAGNTARSDVANKVPKGFINEEDIEEAEETLQEVDLGMEDEDEDEDEELSDIAAMDDEGLDDLGPPVEEPGETSEIDAEEFLHDIGQVVTKHTGLSVEVDGEEEEAPDEMLPSDEFGGEELGDFGGEEEMLREGKSHSARPQRRMTLQEVATNEIARRFRVRMGTLKEGGKYKLTRKLAEYVYEKTRGEIINEWRSHKASQYRETVILEAHRRVAPFFARLDESKKPFSKEQKRVFVNQAIREIMQESTNSQKKNS